MLFNFVYVIEKRFKRHFYFQSDVLTQNGLDFITLSKCNAFESGTHRVIP